MCKTTITLMFVSKPLFGLSIGLQDRQIPRNIPSVAYIPYKLYQIGKLTLSIARSIRHIQANKSDLFYLVYPSSYTLMLTTHEHFTG